MVELESLASLEAEKAILGALLLNNHSIDEIPFLREEHFASRLNGRLFHAIRTRIDQGEYASPETLAAFFEQDDSLRGVDASSFMKELASGAISLVSLPDFAQVIVDHAVRRHLVRETSELAKRALNPQLDLPISTIIAEAYGALDRLSEGDARDAAAEELLADGAERVVDRLSSTSDALIGLPTGMEELDNLLGGLRLGEMTVLAGRTAMGKSALGQHIVSTIAEKVGPALIFSLEMATEQLAGREISARSGFPYDLVDRSKVATEVVREIANVAVQMRDLPIWVSRKHDLTISELRSQARRLKRTHDIQVVLVDYIQLVRAEARYRGNRTLEVSEVTRGLKMLARDLNIAVLALSQVNRELESRDDKRPRLSDLRESGSIEQDAAAVLLIHRPDVYMERSGPAKGQDEAEFNAELVERKKFVELIIPKNRYGRTATIKVRADLTTNRFGDRVSERSQ